MSPQQQKESETLPFVLLQIFDIYCKFDLDSSVFCFELNLARRFESCHCDAGWSREQKDRLAQARELHQDKDHPLDLHDEHARHATEHDADVQHWPVFFVLPTAPQVLSW